MPVSRYVSPFPAFSLSLDEKEQLHQVSDQVITETMAMNERFLWQDKGRLDPTVWKMVREREATRVFHNQLPGAGTGNRDMHLLLTMTTMPGTLNDAMYGIINPTIESFRLKSTYVEDTLFDMAVLEHIVLPTPELAFESLTLRWAVKRVPLHVRLVSKHTDTVYIETSGMRQLSNGERVGVHLFHSITISQMPPLPQYDRFNLSLCEIWRETAPGTITSYMTSYFEFKESFKVPYVILSMADACLSNGKVMECALLKKLTWLVQNKYVLGTKDRNAGLAFEEGCSVCGSDDRSARRGLKSACAICCKQICKKCHIKQTLSLFAPDGQLLRHEMRFCVLCLTSAKQLDGAAIAKDEASGGDDCRSREGGSRTMSVASHYITSSMSTTSSQSGDEVVFSRQHRNSIPSGGVKGRALMLSSSPNLTRAPTRATQA